MSVVARRIPVSRPGRDSASKYVNGTAPIISNNKKKSTQAPPDAGNGDPAASTMANVSSGASEEEMISAMFQAQGEQWKQTQEHMANANPVYYSSQKKGGYQPNIPDHPPPPGYLCYRCGQKGHWIQACPTNNDPNWEGKRIRRTTGIPRSMLKTVTKPEEDADPGTSNGNGNSSYMINDEGEYVVAVADNASWQNFQSKAQAYKEAQSGKPSDPELEDPITHKLFEKPVKTPCCGKTYSDDAIQEVLLEKDFVCPNCGQEEVLLDQLVPDEEMEKRVQKYKNGNNEEPQNGEDAAIQEGEAEEEGKNGSDSATTVTAKRKRDDDNDDEENNDDGEGKEDEENKKQKTDEDTSGTNNETTDVNNQQQQQMPWMMPPMPPFMPPPPMMGMPFPPFMPPPPMMDPSFMMQMQNGNNNNNNMMMNQGANNNNNSNNNNNNGSGTAAATTKNNQSNQ